MFVRATEGSKVTLSYQEIREEVLSGNETDVPFYLISFFEKGPDHYLIEKVNRSRGLPG